MDNNKKSSLAWLFAGCMATAVAGALVFAYKSNYIIIRGIWITDQVASIHQTAQKKEVVFYYHRNGKWQQERGSLLWLDDTQQNIFSLIQQWLFTLHQEQLIHKKVTLQSAIISPDTHTLYLSFDRSFLTKEATTHESWLLLEGLLKTLRTAKTPTQSVYFLVNHKPLQDPHLDCSRAWPISGFENN